MEEAETPREYEYKLKAEDFEKLFLASDEEFDELKGKLLQDNSAFIKRERGQTRLSNVHITGNISIKNVSLNNCAKIFCDHVKIEDLVISGSNLSYLNGKHKTIFNLQDCEIGGIYVNANSSFGYLIIENDCKISQIEICNGNIDYLQVNETLIQSLSIKYNSSFKRITSNSSIIQSIDFIQSETELISIVNSSTGDWKICESTLDKVDFHCSGIGAIKIEESKLDFFISDLTISNDFEIENSTIKSFSVLNNTCSFKFSNSIVNYTKIHNCRIHKVSFGLVGKTNMLITSSLINEFYFQDTIISSDTVITISNSSLFFLRMVNFTVFGSLFFRHIVASKEPFQFKSFDESVHFNNVQKPYLSKIRTDSELRYIAKKVKYEEEKGISKKPTIHISYSSLASTEFVDCTLADFLFEFSYSKIFNCFICGESLPKEISISIATKDSLKWLEQRASFFNQFKKIFENQGDIYHATQFQAKWAEEQLKLLKLKRQVEKGWFTTTFSDLWVLRLNRWSNLHGESWPLAFVFLLGTGLVFYLFYLLSIGRLFNGNEIDRNLIGYYFEFLNPAHKLNFIEGNENVNGCTVFVDYFGRVVIAFGIYQFIAAFRKHTKKQ